MRDEGLHAPDVEGLFLSAAYLLTEDISVVEALLRGVAIPRDRLDRTTLERAGESVDGEPLSLNYEVAVRVAATRPIRNPVHEANERASRAKVASPQGLPDDLEAPTLGAVPDYPTELLPTAARPLVELGEQSGLPAALVGGAALAALASALGSGAELHVTPTWRARAILWLALIAPAGAGKSPAQELAYGPIRAFDALLVDDHPLLVGDPTLEALVRILNETDTATLDVDELSQLLRGLGEYKRGQGGDRGRFLKLWTGDPLRYVRVGGGGKPTNQVHLYVARPTVVICGGLQTRLHELLGGEDDGMRPRWLPHLALMPTDIGHLPDVHAPGRWNELLTDQLLPRRYDERTWKLSEEAKSAFDAYRRAWKEQARQESGAVSAALTKADVHLARVALVLAEAEQPGQAGLVTCDTLERAVGIVNFTLDCFRALPEQGSLSLSYREAKLDDGVERLRAWLEEHGGEATRRELQQRRVAGARTATDLDALLKRFDDTFPGCVTEAAHGHGGLPTVVVRAPARKPSTAAVLTVATPRRAGADEPRPYGPPDSVDARNTALGVDSRNTADDSSAEQVSVGNGPSTGRETWLPGDFDYLSWLNERRVLITETEWRQLERAHRLIEKKREAA